MGRLAEFLSSRKPYLNDGGIETTLIFRDGFDLPMFAAFPLYQTREGCMALERYYGTYMDIAEKAGRGFLLDTATWRANMGWAGKLGYSESDIRKVNLKAVRMAARLREERQSGASILVNGNVGPSGDGYHPDTRLTYDQAEQLHRPQIESFAEAGIDLITALTMTSAAEAIGVARAASSVNAPVVLSFTVETDGRLPDGSSLGDAIAEVDASTGETPLFYGINCAHPTHFLGQLSGDWTKRVGLIRANASRLSHAELDEATELDDGDPHEFGLLYDQVAQLLPNLRIVGGCCGTDHRHVASAVHLDLGENA